MNKFIPREKLSKKAKRAMDNAQRQSWSISPVTRTGKNGKAYVREKPRYRVDDGIEASCLIETLMRLSSCTNNEYVSHT